MRNWDRKELPIQAARQKKRPLISYSNKLQKNSFDHFYNLPWVFSSKNFKNFQSLFSLFGKIVYFTAFFVGWLSVIYLVFYLVKKPFFISSKNAVQLRTVPTRSTRNFMNFFLFGWLFGLFCVGIFCNKQVILYDFGILKLQNNSPLLGFQDSRYRIWPQ